MNGVMLTDFVPQADFTNPGFVPIARDVHLDPGTYYIVIDGDRD